MGSSLTSSIGEERSFIWTSALLEKKLSVLECVDECIITLLPVAQTWTVSNYTFEINLLLKPWNSLNECRHDVPKLCFIIMQSIDFAISDMITKFKQHV